MNKIKLTLLSMLILLIGITTYSVSLDNSVRDIATNSKSRVSQGAAQQKQTQMTNGRNILYTVNADAALKQMYPTIDELNNSNAADAIIKGTVSDVQNVYIGGVAYSVLTIDVLKSYKGNPAKTIKVYEDGGYVKIKDMLDELQGHIDVNSLSQEQIENGVVDVRFFNAPHSTPGQQVILYLVKNPNPLQKGSFQIVSSLYGRFTLDKSDGYYKRLALDTKDDVGTDNQNKNDLVIKYEASKQQADMENMLRNIR